MAAERHIFPGLGAPPVIQPRQDSRLALFLLATRPLFLGRDAFHSLALAAAARAQRLPGGRVLTLGSRAQEEPGSNYSQRPAAPGARGAAQSGPAPWRPPPPAILKSPRGGPLWTSFQLLPVLLPPDFSLGIIEVGLRIRSGEFLHMAETGALADWAPPRRSCPTHPLGTQAQEEAAASQHTAPEGPAPAQQARGPVDAGALWAATGCTQEMLLEAVFRHSPDDATRFIHATAAVAAGLFEGPASISLSISDFHALHKERREAFGQARDAEASGGLREEPAGPQGAPAKAPPGPPSAWGGAREASAGSPPFSTPSARLGAAHAPASLQPRGLLPPGAMVSGSRLAVVRERVPPPMEGVEGSLLLMAISGSKGSCKQLDQQVGPCCRQAGAGSLYGGLRLGEQHAACSQAHPGMLLEETAVSRPGVLSKELREGLRDLVLQFDGSARVRTGRTAGPLVAFPPNSVEIAVGHGRPNPALPGLPTWVESVPAWALHPEDPQPQEAVGILAAQALAQPLTQMALEAGHDGGHELASAATGGSPTLFAQVEVRGKGGMGEGGGRG